MADNAELPTDNEIIAAARAAKASEARANHVKDASRARRWQIGKLGLGVGIGSAAVAAAVMFVSRDRMKDEEPSR